MPTLNPNTQMGKDSSKSNDIQTKAHRDQYAFGELFAEISQSYPDLNVPSETELNELEEAYIRVKEGQDTRSYIAATSTAVLLILTFPILLVWGYHAITSLQISLLPYIDQRAYLNSNKLLSGVLGMVSLSMINYGLLFHKDISNWPLLRLLPSFIRQHLNFKVILPHLKSEGWRFRLYQVLMTYIGLGIATFLIYNAANATVQSYAAFAVRAWLLLPVVPLSASPIILLMLLFVIFSRENESQEAILVAIRRNILLLLKIFKDISKPNHISTQDRLKAIDRIEKTAALFSRLYTDEHSSTKVGLWSQARMSRVSDNFLALSAWVSFPRSDSVASLKKQLVNYANVVSSGTFDDLPSKKVDETFPFLTVSRKRGYLRRLGSLLWLLILVTLPLLVYVGFAITSNWTIPKPLQTPAVISYSAWVAACLFAHIEELAPEAKTTLIDILKLILRK